MKEQNTQVIPQAAEYPAMPHTFGAGIDNYEIRLGYWRMHCDRIKATEKKADLDLSKHNQKFGLDM
ncbi:MAG: hypothetical protein L6Q66_14310 [Bacteroidia bacterium]|nr:hypothetical protein [Bacteroidia bacterium]